MVAKYCSSWDENGDNEAVGVDDSKAKDEEEVVCGEDGSEVVVTSVGGDVDGWLALHHEAFPLLRSDEGKTLKEAN
ncbi:unnamed protein product [Cuscuta campestris]|uniref:Uncharacterized protein n=1 Tax=Cuscuta campestris TaxID=132261 RepID=A0A484L6I6_9ASTE|nr:unnamed protein product [Cuscuta campestris]